MKKVFNRKIISLVFLVVFVFLVMDVFSSVVLAQNPPGTVVTPTPAECKANPNMPGCPADPNPQKENVPKAELQNPLGKTVTIPQIVSKLVKLILGLVGVISLLMFLYAGFVWLTAQGKTEAIKKGRDTMVWAVIGLVVIFSSYIILNYIFDVLTF